MGQKEADGIVLKAETLFGAHRSTLSNRDRELAEDKIEW
jgi:hypothetical protein